MNKFLKKMGYGPADRVLITHIDDIGFSHAANIAASACLQTGAASCGSVITAAPWFTEFAQICQQYPAFDIGVHLTLTSEFPLYRWSAVSHCGPTSGLHDQSGYLWQRRGAAVEHVSVAEATAEMRAQIERALKAGLEISHIDTHMGSVVDPKFLRSYLDLAREYAVPAFLPNISRDRLQALGKIEQLDSYMDILETIDSQAIPTLDEVIIDTLWPQHLVTQLSAHPLRSASGSDSEQEAAVSIKAQYYRDLITSIKPGLTHLLFHPAKMSDELSAIDQLTCASRHADYLAFSDPSLKQFIDASDIHLIGYGQIKEFL
ncbi:MAG: polysaccharide deacetylase family protein [Pseudomonadales bacterium]|nr:polysaccharide deacetylase family protein [Pseudomonadales bacterium]